MPYDYRLKLHMQAGGDLLHFNNFVRFLSNYFTGNYQTIEQNVKSA